MGSPSRATHRTFQPQPPTTAGYATRGAYGARCSSLVETDKIELAKELEKKAAAKGVKFILPTDVILANKFAADADTKVPHPPSFARSTHLSAFSLTYPPCPLRSSPG